MIHACGFLVKTTCKYILEFVKLYLWAGLNSDTNRWRSALMREEKLRRNRLSGGRNTEVSQFAVPCRPALLPLSPSPLSLRLAPFSSFGAPHTFPEFRWTPSEWQRPTLPAWSRAGRSNSARCRLFSVFQRCYIEKCVRSVNPPCVL